MSSVGSFGRFWWCAVVAPWLVACGGSVSTGPGSGGGPATGGSAGTSCTYAGKTYADGDRFPASDGCNTCACQAGSVSCTLVGCSGGCTSGGQTYRPGQSFQIDCNTCTCQADGGISCTEIACANQCDSARDQYAVILSQAKVCDPKQPNQCTAVAAENPLCGCETAVNADNVVAQKKLAAWAEQVSSQCELPACAPCPEPGPATCTPEGRCQNSPFGRGDVACKVNGVVYAHGATGIPAPGNCNTCSCDNGKLALCGKKACPAGESQCPAGTLPASQCAQCGPTDACQIVEHACLPTCTGACANGFCSDGVCRQICG